MRFLGSGKCAENARSNPRPALQFRISGIAKTMQKRSQNRGPAGFTIENHASPIPTVWSEKRCKNGAKNGIHDTKRPVLGVVLASFEAPSGRIRDTKRRVWGLVWASFGVCSGRICDTKRLVWGSFWGSFWCLLSLGPVAFTIQNAGFGGWFRSFL